MAWGLAAVAIVIGLPVVTAAGALEARQRAAGAADAAALAAADAALGWIAAEPCALAREVTDAARAELVDCQIEGMEVRIWVRVGSVLGPVEMRARAGAQMLAARGP